jgi:hypothetical protein
MHAHFVKSGIQQTLAECAASKTGAMRHEMIASSL